MLFKEFPESVGRIRQTILLLRQKPFKCKMLPFFISATNGALDGPHGEQSKTGGYLIS
jgi:hypothetical protein